MFDRFFYFEKFLDRHQFGFESRRHLMPFSFEKSDDFIDFVKQSEISAPWLSCLADLNQAKDFDFYTSRFLQWRHFGEESEEKMYEKASRYLPRLR